MTTDAMPAGGALLAQEAGEAGWRYPSVYQMIAVDCREPIALATAIDLQRSAFSPADSGIFPPASGAASPPDFAADANPILSVYRLALDRCLEMLVSAAELLRLPEDARGRIEPIETGTGPAVALPPMQSRASDRPAVVRSTVSGRPAILGQRCWRVRVIGPPPPTPHVVPRPTPESVPAASPHLAESTPAAGRHLAEQDQARHARAREVIVETRYAEEPASILVATLAHWARWTRGGRWRPLATRALRAETGA